MLIPFIGQAAGGRNERVVFSGIFGYNGSIVIEQIVDIPASHRLTIEVPPEIPTGRAILAFTPEKAETAGARDKSDAEYLKRKDREAQDIELINRDVEWLNREMADVLLDQVDV